MHDFTKSEKQPGKQENPFISLLMNNMYPGITLFARDVNLLPGFAEKYRGGNDHPGERIYGRYDPVRRHGHEPSLRDPFQPHEEFCYAGEWEPTGGFMWQTGMLILRCLDRLLIREKPVFFSSIFPMMRHGRHTRP